MKKTVKYYRIKIEFKNKENKIIYKIKEDERLKEKKTKNIISYILLASTPMISLAKETHTPINLENDTSSVINSYNNDNIKKSNESNSEQKLLKETITANNNKEINTISSSINRDHYKVFIDPGHGGSDPGAVSLGNYEDEINLEVSKKLEDILMARGIEVKMSRETDESLTLTQRANEANNYGADIFVSIHQNAWQSSNVSGIETYHSPNSSKGEKLSEMIHENLIQDTKANDRGVKDANFTVLKKSNMPATLVESGFITNKSEASKLSNENYQQTLANAIANGVVEYLNKYVNIKEDNSQNTISTGTVVENINELNVRSGPSTSHSIVGTLEKKTKIEILSINNGWYKIKYGKSHAYVSSNYIINNGASIPEEEFNIGVVTSSSLNVRSGTSTSYPIIGNLKKDDKVKILSSYNGWHQIMYNNRYGYVSDSYIKLLKNEDDNTSENTKTGTVNINALNVRSGPSTSYEIIDMIKRNDTVEIISSENGWYKIKNNNRYGYVSSKYIDTKHNIPTIKKGTVLVDNLNVRAGSSIKHDILTTYKKGSKVDILSTSNGWHKIVYKEDQVAYVSAQYISIK